MPTARLDRRGDWAVRDAANKVCLSAMQHGYTFAHLARTIFQPDEQLAVQLSCRNGRPESFADGQKRLLRIWKGARLCGGQGQPGDRCSSDSPPRAGLT